MIEPVHHDLFTRRALGAYTHSSGAHANALLAMSGADWGQVFSFKALKFKT